MSTPVDRGEMSASEYRFIEPFLERACYMCGSKDSWRRHKKLLACGKCHTEFMPMPDGTLAIMSRPHQPAPAAA